MSGSGYGGFIWSAYGAAFAVVAGLVLRAVIDHRLQLRALRRLQAASPTTAPDE